MTALPEWMIKHEHKCVLDPKYAPYNCLMNEAMRIAWELINTVNYFSIKDLQKAEEAIQRIEKLGEK